VPKICSGLCGIHGVVVGVVGGGGFLHVKKKGEGGGKSCRGCGAFYWEEFLLSVGRGEGVESEECLSKGVLKGRRVGQMCRTGRGAPPIGSFVRIKGVGGSRGWRGGGCTTGKVVVMELLIRRVRKASPGIGGPFGYEGKRLL